MTPGSRRLLPLKNCTRVTRIGKSKLIYEHFRKPFEGWPINLNNHTSSNISSFSGSIQNWNGSSAETQHKKDKRKLTRRWDSEQMENEVTIQPIFDEDDKSVHMGNANKNALKTLPHISTLCDSGSSTVITSRLIKDPRLAKRELNLGKQSGETMFHGNSQSENEMKISANPMPEEFFLLDAKHELRQRQYIEKTAWKEKTSEECVSPSLLNSIEDYKGKNEERLDNINKEIVASDNTYSDHFFKNDLSSSSLKSKDFISNNSSKILVEDHKGEKSMKYLENISSQLNPCMKLANEWKSVNSQPNSITVHNRKEKLIIETPCYGDPDLNICRHNSESVASGKDKIGNKSVLGSQEDDGYTSEIECSTDFDEKHAINNYTSSEREDGETCIVQDHMLQSGYCKKVHGSENTGEVWNEDNYIFEWSSDKTSTNNSEQSNPQAMIQSEKSSVKRENNSIYEKEEDILNKEKEGYVKERVSNTDNQPHDSSRTNAVMKHFSEKSMCLPKSEYLDINIFKDSREYLSLKIFVDRKRDHETNIVVANGFDEIHTTQLQEGPLWEEKSRRSEMQISSTENAAEKVLRKQNNGEKDLQSTDDRKCMKKSEYSDYLSSESSSCVLNKNFQRCSLTDAQLTSIECGKEKFEDLHKPTLLTKCAQLTTHQEKNHAAFMFLTSVPESLGNIEHREIKNSQSEHTSSSHADTEVLNNLSCKDNAPEALAQTLKEKCEDTNIQDLEVTNDFENVLEGSKNYLPVPQKLPCHGNLSDGKNEYHYLQKRIDWDNLFVKPSLKSEILGNPSMTVSEDGGKSVEEEAESLDTIMCPDLRITVNNKFQSKLKEDTGKHAAEYPGWKMGFKSVQEKIMEKYTNSQKKKKHYQRRKACDIHCSSEICSSLFFLKRIGQSEKHINNILNALNTEALLCENKCLSQKIDGAMFHLRKAQRRVQALKSIAKAGRKNPRNSLRSYKGLHHRSLPLDSPVGLGWITDTTSSIDNVRNTKIEELEALSEKPTNFDIMELKNMKQNDDNYLMNNKQQFYLKVNSEHNIQENVTAIMRNKKQNFSSEDNGCTSKNIAKHLNSATERKELVLCQADERKGGCTCKQDITRSPALFTTVQSASESSAKVLKPDDTPIVTVLENIFSSEEEILDKSPAEQENIKGGAGRSFASSVCLPIAEDKHNVRVCQALLTPEMHAAGSLSLKTRSNNSSDRNEENNCSEKLTESFSKPRQESNSRRSNNILKLEHLSPNELSQAVEPELCSAENRNYKPLTISVKQPESKTWSVSSSGNKLSPMPLVDNNLLSSSDHCALQEQPGEKIKEIGILETKRDVSKIEPCIINNISVKPVVKIVFEQKDTTQASHITSSEESTYRLTSSNSTNQVTSLLSDSLIRTVSKQDVKAITATTNLPPDLHDIPDKNFTASETRLNENCLSGEHSHSCRHLNCDNKCSKIEMEPQSLDFEINISEILRKADETSSLNVLHEKILFCRSNLQLFVTAFEKKQGCPLEHVLVSREILGKVERNMQVTCKLNPDAIDSLVELQIVMETIEFIENKKRLLEGEPTFRSLLWYDDSLHSELFGGQSGYQQQSNFYPAFQRKLKYSAVSELQSYHKQLVEVFENTRWENNSYYSFLKSKREIEECEAAMKSNSLLSEFFLSVPYVCGANYGDTLQDLENARKNTVDLINIPKRHPGVNLSAEKEEHLWIIMEIIATKIEYIKTCEEVNIKASLFGLEHIVFDAAKSFAWKERGGCINGDFKVKEQQMFEINEAALSKLYEIYETMVDDYYITHSPISHQTICYIGEILDEAQSANTERLQQLVCRCTEHMEMLKEHFQILQEKDVSVLITKENVLRCIGGISSVILKPEAVEVYTEIAMLYETVFFLENLTASKLGKPRFRSLLWFDVSLLPELFRCQEKMASLSYRNDNLLNMIESLVSELQDELNVVYDYSENLNCSYALHLLTRELEELSETRSLLEESKSPISMCVDLVPYTICLNYGSTVSELECNYNQFSSLLEKLMLAERKDLGKMAHVMKIMKTIEHMKFICSEQGKSPLPLIICQMVKNWRKSCQLKRQDMKAHLDTSGGYSIKQSPYYSEALHKRPANMALEDNTHSPAERSDSSHKKKKKSEKCSFPKGRELQISISTDNPWNKNTDVLTENSPIETSQLKDLNVVYSFECILPSSNASSPDFFNSTSRTCQSTKEHDEEYVASYDRGKCISVPSVKFQSPQRSPEDSPSSVANLNAGNSLLPTLNEHNLKSNDLGNDSDVISDCCTAIKLSSELDRNRENSCLYPETSFNENTPKFDEHSASSQNEYLDETSQMQNPSATRTVYPDYSWYFCQADSSSHLITQTYQEFSSYEMNLLTPGISGAVSMVYNTRSSMFYSQTSTHFGAREIQRFNFAQTYSAHGYFSSTVAFPFGYHQQTSWYTENNSLPQYIFPYPYNIVAPIPWTFFSHDFPI
uniref:Testis expressed sequence 15 domain-containing protein n=1 Tax=Varanus komodoensis TaxID=61221 RepID=A0A8D2JC31_VARKO